MWTGIKTQELAIKENVWGLLWVAAHVKVQDQNLVKEERVVMRYLLRLFY